MTLAIRFEFEAEYEKYQIIQETSSKKTDKQSSGHSVNLQQFLVITDYY